MDSRAQTILLCILLGCCAAPTTVSSSVSHASRRLPIPAARTNPDGSPVQGRMALTQTPLNHAAVVGETVVLVCEVAVPPPYSRVMWGEYISHPRGSIISDNDFVLSHPNRDRYRILHLTDTQFYLEIRDVRLEDGGKYVCMDTLAGPPDVYRGEAELIILESTPNCTTTLPPGGVVVEGQTYTAECIIHYQGFFAPTMTWSGPPPYLIANSPSHPSTVWSRIEFTVDRTMDVRAFGCLTNFTDIGSVPADLASNTPRWRHSYTFDQMSVYWGPKDMSITPIKPYYEVGDELNCYADAFPPAYYTWQNLRTLETYSTLTFPITQSMVGFNQTIRCMAQNLIQGFLYTNRADWNVDVPIVTSTSTDPPSSPTTTPPAECPCNDRTGRWVSQNPYAEVVLQVFQDSEVDEIEGIKKDLTDTVWVEVKGTPMRGSYLYVNLTAIWPFENGVPGFAGIRLKPRK